MYKSWYSTVKLTVWGFRTVCHSKKLNNLNFLFLTFYVYFNKDIWLINNSIYDVGSIWTKAELAIIGTIERNTKIVSVDVYFWWVWMKCVSQWVNEADKFVKKRKTCIQKVFSCIFLFNWGNGCNNSSFLDIFWLNFVYPLDLKSKTACAIVWSHLFPYATRLTNSITRQNGTRFNI